MEKPCLIKFTSHAFNNLTANPITPKHVRHSPGLLFNIQEVLIFKTGIETQADKLLIKATLDKHPLIVQWNIDLEDVDRVLRVVTKYLAHNDIIEMITPYGYCCEELV